jgi:hypothetical protein
MWYYVLMPRLSHERLIEILRYDPEEGKFYWIKRISIRVKAVGADAGSLRRDGYLEIGIEGERFLAHRLAWFYVNGYWPEGQIDHKDMDRLNNRWANLRDATHGQNVHNSGARRNNTSGYKGVHYRKDLGRWEARIMSNKRLHIIGWYDTPLLAHDAYSQKAKELHGEFARS